MSDKTKIDEHKYKEFSTRTNQLISLTVLILTICATFSSLYAGANSRKGILAQNQATDLWAFYQAKSIKQTLYENRIEMLKISPPADTELAAKLAAEYTAEIERYDVEQQAIKADALAKGVERDNCLSLNRGFASALTFLQISILLTSLATLMKRLFFRYAGIALGALGIVIFLKTMLVA